jgi:hypothetical protein
MEKQRWEELDDYVYHIYVYILYEYMYYMYWFIYHIICMYFYDVLIIICH